MYVQVTQNRINKKGQTAQLHKRWLKLRLAVGIISANSQGTLAISIFLFLSFFLSFFLPSNKYRTISQVMSPIISATEPPYIRSCGGPAGDKKIRGRSTNASKILRARAHLLYTAVIYTCETLWVCINVPTTREKRRWLACETESLGAPLLRMPCCSTDRINGDASSTHLNLVARARDHLSSPYASFMVCTVR
jgi:hypothetical protein